LNGKTIGEKLIRKILKESSHDLIEELAFFSGGTEESHDTSRGSQYPS
jgi:hypothetical protein